MFILVKLIVTALHLICFRVTDVATETPQAGPRVFQETPSEKQALLTKHKIVPKILAQQPQHVLFGDYGGKEISFGNTFKPEEIKDKPIYLDWPVNGTKSLYCLLAIGIDVPNEEKPKLKDFRHWMVGNIPGTDVEKGTEVFPYIGAGHFYDQGTHRIVFVVFQQPGKRKIKFYERKLKHRQPIYVSRGNTSTIKFAEKYGFRQPVAANFLTVETGVPQSTTDYYAHTTIEVPFDWQGISLGPEDFGLPDVIAPED